MQIHVHTDTSVRTHYMLSSLIFHLQIIIANKTLSFVRRWCRRRRRMWSEAAVTCVICIMHLEFSFSYRHSHCGWKTKRYMKKKKTWKLQRSWYKVMKQTLQIMMHQIIVAKAANSLRCCSVLNPMSMEALNLHAFFYEICIFLKF